MTTVDKARAALLPLRGYPDEDGRGNRLWTSSPDGAYVGFEDAVDAVAALIAAVRAEGLDDDERTSIYDSAWLQGYEKARAEGLDAAALPHAPRCPYDATDVQPVCWCGLLRYQQDMGRDARLAKDAER